MNREIAQKFKTSRSPALKRNRSSSSTNEETSVSAMCVRTRAPKRKASPDTRGPRKRTKVSETGVPKNTTKDLRKRVFKRKFEENVGGPPKKKRQFVLEQGDKESGTSSSAASSNDPLEGCSTSEEDVSKRRPKRKADTEGDWARKKRKRNPERDTVIEETTKDLTVDPLTEFKAKYEEQQALGEGGCGSVFAGCRKKDNLLVAIKHIPKDKVFCKHTDKNGKVLASEVAIMLELMAEPDGSEGTLAPVSLLDWYNLKHELILVMERPVPCVDLSQYIKDSGGFLAEDKAKIIAKQLVDAVKGLEDKHIFHRDIKTENLLVETSSDVPRLRLIDFGLGCFFEKRSFYKNFYGTVDLAPPEWLKGSIYRPGPATVWQVGAVLFELLHKRTRFSSTKFLKNKQRIKRKLSENCQDFLGMCLNEDPKLRPALEELQRHPWLG